MEQFLGQAQHKLANKRERLHLGTDKETFLINQVSVNFLLAIIKILRKPTGISDMDEIKKLKEERRGR